MLVMIVRKPFRQAKPILQRGNEGELILQLAGEARVARGSESICFWRCANTLRAQAEILRR